MKNTQKTFLIPAIPFTLKDFSEVRNILFNIVQLMKVMIDGFSSSTDVSWLTSTINITDDKYIY